MRSSKIETNRLKIEIEMSPSPYWQKIIEHVRNCFQRKKQHRRVQSHNIKIKLGAANDKIHTPYLIVQDLVGIIYFYIIKQFEICKNKPCRGNGWRKTLRDSHLVLLEWEKTGYYLQVPLLRPTSKPDNLCTVFILGMTLVNRESDCKRFIIKPFFGELNTAKSQESITRFWIFGP